MPAVRIIEPACGQDLTVLELREVVDRFLKIGLALEIQVS
jgi:hypothetical protein